MRFFTEENHRVRVDLEIKVIKEFRLLIAKDKDREKREATKWFAFLYYLNDYRSPFFNYAAKERFERVLKNVELPPTFKIFKELQDAQDKYLEFQETATVRTLKSIKEGLITSSRVIDLLTDQINTTLEAGIEDLDSEDVDLMTKNVDRMLGLSDKLPKAIKTITALEEEVKKEQAGDSKIRGGGSKGDFED